MLVGGGRGNKDFKQNMLVVSLGRFFSENLVGEQNGRGIQCFVTDQWEEPAEPGQFFHNELEK